MSSPPSALTAPPSSTGPFRFGPYLLDVAQARLTRDDGEALALAGQPFELLAVLVRAAGSLVDKDDLLDAVWGHRHVSESVLKGAINTVRVVIGDDARAPVYIETVPRRGYRFIAEVGQVAAAPPAPSPGARAVAELVTAPGNVPEHVERPVGREAETALLIELLAARRLVTVTGLGGVGKTCLALALAAQVAEPGGGRWLLRLDELSDPALLRPTLVRLLRLEREAAASAKALARALADAQLLLVLDNAEHLVDEVAELCAALHEAAPGVQMLVTSQLPLRLAAEAVLPLAPLALPPDGPDDGSAPESCAAARLLVMRIRQHRAQWLPTGSDPADIAAICRALDGVPLALELAAARVPLLGVSGVRARLDQRFSLLTRGHRGAAARQRTLAAALDWTVGLLDDAGRLALQQLAVFSGSFGLDGAEAVLGETALDHVEELRARSLLVAEHGLPGMRLRLYDSVRRHALEAQGAGEAQFGARLRLLAWMAQRAQGLWWADLCASQEAWLPVWRHDLDSLRAALRFGLAEGAPGEALRLALRLAADTVPLWHRGGLFAEGDGWLQAARARAAALEADGVAVDAETSARLDLACAIYCGNTQQGDPRVASVCLQRAWPWAEAQPDPLWRYLALHTEYDLCNRLQTADLDRYDALVQRMEQCVQPDWPPLARRPALRVAAAVRRLHGDYDGMLAVLAEYRSLCRAQGARTAAVSSDFLLLQGLLLTGRDDQARAAADELMVELRSLGAVREHVFQVAMAAVVHLRLGLRPGDREGVVSALRQLAGTRLLWWLADALPWAAWHDGRPGDAARIQAWADRLADARGEHRGPLFGGLRAALLAQLASVSDPEVAGGPAPADEAKALDLALGEGTALAVMPASA